MIEAVGSYFLEELFFIGVVFVMGSRVGLAGSVFSSVRVDGMVRCCRIVGYSVLVFLVGCRIVNFWSSFYKDLLLFWV